VSLGLGPRHGRLFDTRHAQEVLEVGVAEGLRGLDDAVEVRVVELHDDVELVVLHGDDEVLERDDVGVLRERERGDGEMCVG
jgi:hypothetical protein